MPNSIPTDNFLILKNLKNKHRSMGFSKKTRVTGYPNILFI